MHLGLVLNGKAVADEALRQAVADLRDEGIAVDVRVTWESGDAARCVEELIALGGTTLVAAGGDGTLGEVASALASMPGSAEVLPALAVVPLGTANDFAVAAGVPEAVADALALCRRPPVPVDLLRIAADDAVRHCINLASGGFGTAITRDTGAGLKKALGGLAYVLQGLLSLGRIEPLRARFEGGRSEGGAFVWEGDFIALGIGNGRQAGGGQPLCPDACIDDGLLDLTLVPPLEGEMAATLGTLLAEGREAALDQASVRARLASLRIVAEAPLVLNLDGEPLEAARFEIACEPARLRMHLPVDCPLLFGA
ncbi:MAG: lipid kinase YegS [Lysobacter sp.]|nr:lipid kinase YegS [Lysobacter sp.]